MAEPGTDIRRILLLAGVVVVVLFSLLFFFFRSCVPAVVQKAKGYTVIYSNLDLKDAANVVVQLKKLAIPYEIREEGRAVAVPKDKADQARLGLAEENLPAGGVVGWEIFDETRMGATDFDRRIQLIRAISGELSRTIRRIEGVADARVQVVLPETRLFEVTKVPVTASVMLRLYPGAELSSNQINGIVHLVASSVENLLPENVTVVDDTGRILTVKAPPLPPPVAIAPEVETATSEVGAATPEVEAAVTKEALAAAPPLSPEEKVLLRVKTKRELEDNLASKAQELLNKFYPPNSTIVRLDLDLEWFWQETGEGPVDNYKIKRISAVILVDNRVGLSRELKDSTFMAVAGAIGYNRKRGDHIILRRVPFHMAILPPEVVKVQVEKMLPPPPPPKKRTSPFVALMLGVIIWSIILALMILVVFALVRFVGGKIKIFEPPAAMTPAAGESQPESKLLSKIRNLAEVNPEKIANLLKSWLAEK